MADKRVQAAEAVTNSIRTGEAIAGRYAEPHLADDVILDTGSEQVQGKARVLERISGVWPSTGTFYQGGWTEPEPNGDTMKVRGAFPIRGAAPTAMNLTFSYNKADQINAIKQEITRVQPQHDVATIPDHVRGEINGALANGTPVAVSYVDEQGQPKQSLRGSTIVYSPTQLAIWTRSPEGGLNRALATNPRLALIYRDSKTRSTVIFEGLGHVETDEETRRRVFELTPGAEQFHDLGRTGAALIIDVTRMQAIGPNGLYRMRLGS